MSKVKTLLLAAASSVVIAGGAMAADMPLKAAPYQPPVVFSWTGCYVGAHWGWGWGKKTGNGSYTEEGVTFATSFGSFNNNKLSGALFGGQIGCNYQWPGSQWVIGLQGDIAGTDINGTAGTNFTDGFTDPFEQSFFTGQVQSKIESIASITGRIGFAGFGNRTLFYVKGGWAWMRERDHLRTNDFGVVTNDFYQSATHSGWTVGGGVEWALGFWSGASVFAEYNYYDFSHKSWTFISEDGGLLTAQTDIKPKVQTVKIGLNYRFW
jgi:outer membrane immunogenic protein